MIMLWGVNKALFWLVCFGLGAVYPEATKCNLATCEIHILPGGRAKEEKKQACRERMRFCLTERSTLGR